jgi:hypothetical protein
MEEDMKHVETPITEEEIIERFLAYGNYKLKNKERDVAFLMSVIATLKKYGITDHDVILNLMKAKTDMDKAVEQEKF